LIFRTKTGTVVTAAVGNGHATFGLRVFMLALKALAIFNSLRLIWVPGHCGIAENEKVDALAKQVSASYFTGPEPSVGISKAWTVHEQNRMWQELSGNRQAKYLLHGFDLARA